MKRSSQQTSLQVQTPEFLPWQIFCLFTILGLFSFKYPVPSFIALVLLSMFLIKKETFRTNIGLCLLLFIIGLGLTWLNLPDSKIDIPKWMENQEEVDLKAEIESVHPKPNHRLQMIVTKARYHCQDKTTGRLQGKVVWKWQDPEQWPSPGQTIVGTVKIKPVWGNLNPGCWDTVFYWHRQGVKYKIFSNKDKDNIRCQGQASWLWKLRLKIRKSILQNTEPGNGQALLLALIMGDRFLVSYSVLDLVRRASLAHSLALSGLHLGFLVFIAWLMAWGVGKIKPSIYLVMPRQKMVILIGIPLILIYLWLGQARPSLVRASLMFFFWAWLFLYGRQNVLLDGLFFALVIILILAPLSVFDLGLQLSLIAVSGIVCFCPVLIRGYWGIFGFSRWSQTLFPIFALLIVSLVANLVLLPVTVWNFAQWNYHLYLNLLWLPILGWIVLPFGLLGAGLSLCPFLGVVSNFFLHLSTWTLDAFVACLDFLSRHGALESIFPLRPSWMECFGYWLLLILIFLYRPRIRAVPWWGLVVGASLLCAPSVVREFDAAQKQVGLELIDVGQGQSVLLEIPGGKRILVDGGGSWNRDFDLGKYILSPYLTWSRSPEIEIVVLTHSDFDHLRGLYFILDNYQVGRFVFNGDWPEGWDKKNLKRILSKQGIPVVVREAGDIIDLGQGLKLEVLHPAKGSYVNNDNDNSLVLRLVYKEKGLALVPGDIEISGIRSCLAADIDLKAEVLVLPHHGSDSSLCPEFYRQVDPKLALASCKRLNYFGFPDKSVKRALHRMDIPLKTTARQGLIQVQWQMPSLEMEVETRR